MGENLEKGGAALSLCAGAHLYPASQDVVISQRCSGGEKAILRPDRGKVTADCDDIDPAENVEA
jgi:hypothetical protein